MRQCLAITEKGRLDYLQMRAEKYLDSIDGDEKPELLHRGVRRAWSGTKAYEVVMKGKSEAVGVVGYKSSSINYFTIFGFDDSEVNTEFINLKNRNRKNAKEEVLRLLARNDSPTC